MTIRYCLTLATAQQVQNFMSVREKPCLLEAGHALLYRSSQIPDRTDQLDLLLPGKNRGFPAVQFLDSLWSAAAGSLFP